MTAVHDCSFKQVDYLPHSLDLAPFDHHLTESQHQIDDDVLSATNNIFDHQKQNFFTDGIQIVQY